MPQPPRVVHLDQLESIPGPGSLSWRPVRSALGIRAFGCNAYTAAAAGQDVVEPHVESDDPADREQAHEELYFVAAGRATFTIDGEHHDAPAGTYVFVPDASSHRHAVAAEPGTTVLSFGGPPVFTPSAWEWAFRAGPLIATDPARARAILDEGLAVHPGESGLLYQLACLHAAGGARDEALAALRAARNSKPEVIAWARDDEDFQDLATDPEFRALIDG
ncbi:MAG: TPR end-of-group domain-containing protein [Solirubrobacteraceae bacterium]